MTELWNELRPKFEFFSRPFPHEAVALACLHREEVAPRLIAVLEAIADNPEPARDGEYLLHLYAMHLLAAWRDARAYRPLARLGRHSEKTVEDLMGDVTTESYGRCLASVCDGDLAPLKALAGDAGASFWARGAALEAMGVRVLEGDGDHAALTTYLGEYGDAEAARLRAPGATIQDLEILDSIVNVATDIGASALLERIRGWFAEGLLDVTVADQRWVERHIVQSFDQCRERLGLKRRGYVRDVAQEMAWWAGFSEEDGSPDDEPDDDYESGYGLTPDTYVRPGPKIGRNDPCPCGSGKKYKKCHGADA
jgi:hypothetical protein